MTNPFEIPDARYCALINDEGQYSLWPEHLDVPSGWIVAHGPDSRQACLDHINNTWVDMRPRSLVKQMTDQS